MTEIPEHLLKRAAERRAAMGGADAPSDPAAPAADAGASAEAAPAAAVTKAAAAPAPLPSLEEDAPKAKPDSPVVAAAKARKRIPFWAAPVLALLPVWGIIYASSMRPPPAGANDPLVVGKEAFVANGCSGCHGATGAGASAGLPGAQLSNGEVLKTFADPLTMAHWILYGADGGARADGTYGDLNRPGGPHNLSTLSGAMPAFPDINPEDLAAIIIYVREELSGGKPADDPNFNADTYTADPAALAAMIEKVKELGPGGDPNIASVPGAETK